MTKGLIEVLRNILTAGRYLPEAAGIQVVPISPAQAVYAQNVQLYLYISARPDLCNLIHALERRAGQTGINPTPPFYLVLESETVAPYLTATSNSSFLCCFGGPNDLLTPLVKPAMQAQAGPGGRVKPLFSLPLIDGLYVDRRLY